MIKAENINKSFAVGEGRVDVFKDYSIEIKEKEAVAVVGPSGSGKSTLLNILGGLDTCDSGKVWFGDTELSALSPKELAVQRLNNFGFVFQKFHLIPTLSAMDNAILPILAAKQKVDMEEAKKVFEALGIKERMRHFPYQLSGGEMQRVAIARAVLKHPKVLFSDEATGNLDHTNSVEVMNLMAACCKNYEITWVFVTHDLSLAAYADRVISMEG